MSTRPVPAQKLAEVMTYLKFSRPTNLFTSSPPPYAPPPSVTWRKKLE